MVCDPKWSIQISSLPVSQSSLASWSFGTSQSCPALCTIVSGWVGCSAPWLAAGFSHSFPAMELGVIGASLVHGPRWETWQQTAMPSTIGAQQRMEHHHHLLLSKYLDRSCMHRWLLWPECVLGGKKPIGAGIFCTPAYCANQGCKYCYWCCVCWCFLLWRSLQKHFIIVSRGHSPFHRYSRNSFCSSVNKQTYHLHLLHCTKDHQYPSRLTTAGW